jgi:pimeloyl-ACP methyl ester carboxylesterase
VTDLPENTVYYLPGARGQLGAGLGQALLDRGCSITGRETRDEFQQLPFDDQVGIIVRDLQDHFWHEDAKVIGNSFGAYLFLHAQSQLPPFIGRVLLLSPIVGEFSDAATGVGFSPPRPDRLRELAESGQFSTPTRCEIHVGEEDWQSIPAHVQAFGALTGIPVTVVPRGGHRLDHGYVGSLLDRWLAT